MYRSRSSLPYDILHGIRFPANLSVFLAYMSYFPPPPPIIPGPPSHESRTCSSDSFLSLFCIPSIDQNPSTLRQYTPFVHHNQSTSVINVSRVSITNISHSNKSSSFDSLIKFIQNHVLSILLFTTLFFLVILLLYFQCLRRRRQLTTNAKTDKFYYHLIPYRPKRRTIVNTNEHNLVRLRKDPPLLHVIQLSKTSGSQTNHPNEAEEAL